MAKIQDLAKYLSKKHKIQQKEAERFLTALVDVLNEGLHYEKLVKVKGLGTFKVIEVKNRESVDVNTGERILIEGRPKITFTPDAVMKDLVNKPFAQFETVVLNEGVTFDNLSEEPEVELTEEPEPQPEIEQLMEEKPALEPEVEEEQPEIVEEQPEEIIVPEETVTEETVEEVLITKDCLQRISDAVCVIHKEVPSQLFLNLFYLRYQAFQRFLFHRYKANSLNLNERILRPPSNEFWF